jgi:uncharacterized Zn finger protein
VKASQWRAICRDCAGSIDSLVELLQGRLAKRVMERVCSKGNGLFPAPEEITLSCSCPDWADMCKHVAATLYGVGARLDEKPELLFVLRDVDEQELLAGASDDLSFGPATLSAKLLDSGDVAALFGLEMAETVDLETTKSKTQRDRKAHGLPTRSQQRPHTRFGEARDLGGFFGVTGRFPAAEAALSRVSGGKAAPRLRRQSTKDYSKVARKPELRRTAWWRRQS